LDTDIIGVKNILLAEDDSEFMKAIKQDGGFWVTANEPPFPLH